MRVFKNIPSTGNCFIVIALLTLGSFGSGLPDSVNALFDRGAAKYDSVLIKKAFNLGVLANGRPDYLFQARCLWRIQVIKFILSDTKGTVTCGKRSLMLLDSAMTAGADGFAVAAVRALASQILAGTGAMNSVLYGPKAGEYLATCKKMRPFAFETRLVEAFNYLEAPPFAGGSAIKACETFGKLHKEFPESTIVTINLARSLLKRKRVLEADSLCKTVLEKTPDDLWAQKVKEAIRRAM
jgi:hypothetical protein